MIKLGLLALMLLGGAACAKSARTYYDEEMMGRVREKIEQHEWAREQVAGAKSSCAWLVEISDQELWDFMPPPEQIRAINVCIAHDCPTCGDEITRQAGHYPWIMSRDRPFKVKCPVCDKEFPSNDFEPWNLGGMKGEPETGPEPTDKGLGWLGPDGRRYYFVAYYIYWQRWARDILTGISSLARAYLLTDEPVYAHKCALMLTKIASEYERFDYENQAYHEGQSGIPGRISDRIWSTGDDSKMALAYDAIWPALGEDGELAAFIKAKGIEEEPRAVIEGKLLRVMADDVMRGFVAGNMGAHQKTLCHLAIVLDNDDPEKGPTTAEMREWIMSGPGRVEDLLWNGFWREGLGGEASPSYSSGWCHSFYEIAELLPRLGVDIWSNPKLKKMADIGLELTVAGRFCPSIGDCGSPRGSGKVAWSASLQGPAFTHYKDPRHAKALSLMGASSKDLWRHLFDEEEVAEVVAREGTDLGLKTRNLGGYGVAILESGEGEHRRGVSMYYGDASGGHGHYDRLNIEMFAHGRAALSEDGYPTPFTRPNFHEWRRANTVRHYCVMVDEMPQQSLHAGDLNTLAGSPGLQLMDASAEIAYGGLASLYRRTTALVDISDEGSYLVDIFRVRGGAQHDWCFHGPPFPEFSVSGGELGPAQEKGTLAGEDVPWGGRPPTVTARGQALDLVRAEGLLPGEYPEPSKKGWAVFGQCILTRCEGAQVRLKTAQEVPAGKVKVFMRIYDYNEGSNSVGISLGDVAGQLRCEPSGTVGYRWITAVYELPQPISEVTLAASELGQMYIQIDNLVISRDLRLEVPRVRSGASSGFQALFNVRRMSPEGAWSATWRKPDEDLALTMTMPAGCTQEVIAADGKPEAQPGIPETIQYVLGRNVLADERADTDEELLSKYIAIAEPHRGDPSVTGVQHLRGANVSEETVGLAVQRGGAVDLIHSSLDPTQQCEWEAPAGGLVCTGEFGLVTVDEEGVKRACLVNGTLLRYGQFALEAGPSPEGTVLSVDHERNAITIDAALAAPEACRDAVVILGNELNRTSYTTTDVEVGDGRTVLGFGDVLFIIGMGEVAETDQAAKTVTSDRKLTGYGRVDGGRHAGRWLFNEDKSRGFRIAAIKGTRFELDGVEGDLEAIFADTDGDGRRVYWISDIGPGDTFRIPATTYAERVEPGRYEVRTMTQARLTSGKG